MPADRFNAHSPVVVTGTSTGIGAATAIHLAEKGFRVFAGVRRKEDGRALQAQTSWELTPLRIDITDEATISAAVDTVTNAVGERGLATRLIGTQAECREQFCASFSHITCER